MNKTFNSVSEKAFAGLGDKLKAQGLVLEGTAGYLSKNGISLDYSYNLADETLIITDLKVGFPASLVGMNEDKVIGILQKAIDDCQ